MSARPVSLAQQAAAVLAVARRDCLKAIKTRQSEAEMLLEHLQAAAKTLAELANGKKPQ